MTQRESAAYQRQKLANMLSSSEAWQQFLKPEIEKTAHKNGLPPITGLDMAFNATNEIAKREYAKYLLALVERLTKEFTQAGDGTHGLP